MPIGIKVLSTKGALNWVGNPCVWCWKRQRCGCGVSTWGYSLGLAGTESRRWHLFSPNTSFQNISAPLEGSISAGAVYSLLCGRTYPGGVSSPERRTGLYRIDFGANTCYYWKMIIPVHWPEVKPCLVLPVLECWKGVWQKRVCYLHGHHDDFLCSALCTKEIQLSPKKAFGLISLVLLAEIIYYDASWSPVSKALSYLLSFNSLNTVKYPADFESGKKDSKSAPLHQGCLLQILN